MLCISLNMLKTKVKNSTKHQKIRQNTFLNILYSQKGRVCLQVSKGFCHELVDWNSYRLLPQ